MDATLKRNWWIDTTLVRSWCSHGPFPGGKSRPGGSKNAKTHRFYSNLHFWTTIWCRSQACWSRGSKAMPLSSEIDIPIGDFFKIDATLERNRCSHGPFSQTLHDSEEKSLFPRAIFRTIHLFPNVKYPLIKNTPWYQHVPKKLTPRSTFPKIDWYAAVPPPFCSEFRPGHF